VRALVAHADRYQLKALSVAAEQRVRGPLLGVLHPAMLTTLVYRFGIPGNATTDVDQVQANGQCFLIDRSLLGEVGGFESVLGSICEDVSLARAVAARGELVGFFMADGLVEVEMYRDGPDAWRNWPRSLPVRDRWSGPGTVVGWLEVLGAQGLPLWLAPLSWKLDGVRSFPTTTQLGLIAMRLGILLGTRSAYLRPPRTYWLSPLADLPVAARLLQMALKRHHSWRGRPLSVDRCP
jgi:dolichol-phosphate mannosyltransferase